MGGEHGAGFYGCERFVQAKRVQEVRELNKVSYAEAVKRVDRESGNGRSCTRAVVGCQLNASNLQSALPSDMLTLTKEAFLSFVSDVLVGAKKAANRSDIIRLVVGAAERFLGITQMPEELHQYMKESQTMDRSQLVRVSSMEDDGEVDEVDPY